MERGPGDSLFKIHAVAFLGGKAASMCSGICSSRIFLWKVRPSLVGDAWNLPRKEL